MEKKIKVFLDSNVLLSIAYTGKEKSRSYLIYEIQEMGIIKVCLSNLVCEEPLFNIRRKKPDSEWLLKELIEKSKILGDIAAGMKRQEILNLPQNDRIIVTTAIYHKADIFVTSNEKDFRNLYHKKVLNTIILRPIDFLNMKF
jgi:predicted nucleic acid-binding protein